MKTRKSGARKRGGLDLSIQTIVIVVLAMTLLGLGLGFIRNQFKNLSETTISVQDQIRQQILDDLRVGNKKLSFPTGNVLLSSGDSKDLAIGVQNLEDTSIKFTLNIYRRDPNGVDSAAFISMQPDSKLDTDEDKDTGVFLWDNTEQTLGLGESRVIGLAFRAPIPQDTYLYKAVIIRTDTIDPNAPAAQGEDVYDAKTFFVTVS